MTRFALASLLALPSLLALVLLAPPALADEADAEALFHEAYVSEVVHGQVEIAATTYLEIASLEDASARLRAEARFRFAVCATLLGRADEARVWLGELAADETAPAGVRERARTYLESLSSVPVGSPLEQKLQDLVFELGRAQARQQTVAVYRDFEVLGEQAVPFLKGLLHHDDQTIRQHAFRILCRMGVEGMGTAWHAGIPFAGNLYTNDVARYFQVPGRETELRALESGLLALEDGPLGRSLGSMRRGNLHFSLDFARALATRDGLAGLVFAFLDAPDDPNETWAQAQEWLEGDDEELAVEAARWIAMLSRVPPEPYDTSLFPKTWRRVLANESLAVSNYRLVDVQPTSALVDALDAVLVADRAWEGGPGRRPLQRGLTPRITGSLLARPAEDVDLERLDGIARRWLAVEAKRRRKALEHRIPGRPVNMVSNETWSLVTYLLRHRSSEDGRALVQWILGDVVRDLPGERLRFGRHVPVDEPGHVPVWMAAMQEVGGVPQHPYWSIFLSHLSQADKSPETKAALFRSVPEWLSFLSETQFTNAFAWMPPVAELLSEAEAVEVVARLLGKLPDGPPAWRRQIADTLFQKRVGTVTLLAPSFAGTVVLPAADRVWAKLPEDVRGVLLQRAARFLSEEARGELVVSVEGRAAIARFLQAHLDDIDEGSISVYGGLAEAWDLVPLESWIPKAPRKALSVVKVVPKARRDAAAEKLAALPGPPTPVVLSYVSSHASPEISKAFFDRLLASEDPAMYGPAVDHVDAHYGTPASAAALERALATLLEQEEVDLRRVRRVARILVTQQPSAKLFPATRALLKAAEQAHVLAGVDLAYKLGQPDLVPDLLPHLASMNQDVRKVAKRAVDSIREIQAIQADAANTPPPR